MKKKPFSEKIFQYLTKNISGDVRFDELSRVLYSKAACMYQKTPLGVVLPRDKRDVTTLVKFACENDISLIGRGSASSLNGQVIGGGIIVDFTKYMNKIIQVADNYALVQPGVILGQLNACLQADNKFFAPDPSSGAYATIGGMIGNNSSGAHHIKYGATRDHLAGLEIVLSNGELVFLEKTPMAPKARLSSLEGKIYRELYQLLKDNHTLIEEKTPRVSKNSSGYNLKGLIDAETLDITKLLAGSEGTLALVTEARLNILPVPKSKTAGLMYFKTLERAAEAIQRILESGPSALEIMDKHFLRLVKDDFPQIPGDADAVLLVEYDGGYDTAREKMESVRRSVADLAAKTVVAYDPAQREKLWNFRNSATPLLSRLPGPKRPVSVIEDIAVTPDKIPRYINEVHNTLKNHGIEAAIHGHAGDGNFHIKPLLDFRDVNGLNKLKSVTRQVYSLALELGGTLSAEHGDGLVRTQFLEEFYGKELYNVFKRVKSIFDRKNILNPGKIIHTTTDTFTDNLRKPLNSPSGTYLDDESFLVKIERCQGCAACKAFCPVYKSLGEESALPRGKITALAAVKDGTLSVETLQTTRARNLIDSCINCRVCGMECPSGVDVGELITLEKTRYMDAISPYLKGQVGFARARLVSDTETIAKGKKIANPLLGMEPARFLLEKAIGLSRKVNLPRLEQNFRVWYRKHNRINSIHKAAYFHGCFANYINPNIGKALVHVLEKNGIETILPEQACCSLALLSQGYLNRKHIQDKIQYNLGSLREMVDKGYDIVATCPSCVHAFTSEYPKYLKGELLVQAKTVAARVYEISDYLISLKAKGKLNLDFKQLELKAAAHSPCHSRAIGSEKSTGELLNLILNLQQINNACCGMGGTFGLTHYDMSVKIGAGLFGELTRADIKRVITPCGACALQIRRQTGVKVLHPIEILHKAYYQ